MKTDTQQQTKHTTGPWHIGVRQPSSDKFIYGPDGGEVADCDRLTNFPDVNLANARLIAAAPDLLDALMVIAKQADTTAATFPNAPGRLDWKQVAAIARAAIARAEGRA